MKIRAGFVSNSSSSSFIMVGTSDRNICRTIAQKAGIPDDSEEFYEYMAEHSTGYGTTSFKDIDIVTDPYEDDKIVCCGVIIGGEYENEVSIDGLHATQAEAACKLAKCSGMNNINPKSLKLIFGESSNGS